MYDCKTCACLDNKPKARKFAANPLGKSSAFRSSAFISVFTTLFAVAIFSFSFCDGIAFCSTIPIYFWQNASPIRLLDVAKKTSDLLVFSLVLLAGFEPARYRYRGILSPLRLPISPQQQNFRVFLQFYIDLLGYYIIKYLCCQVLIY